MYQPAFSLTLPVAARQGYVALDSNTCPFAPAPAIEKELTKMIGDGLLREPPEYGEYNLIEKAADTYRVPASCISAHAGTDAALAALVDELGRDGTVFVAESVTYGAFDRLSYRYQPSKSIEKDPRSIMLERFKMRRGQTVYLANPSNPGGVLYPKAELLEIAETCNLIVDEAYADWADSDQSLLPHVKDSRSIFVLRGFSKSFGLAGIRAALLFGPVEFMEWFREQENHRQLGTLSQVAAEMALDEYAYALDQVSFCKENRSQLVADLTLRGFHALDTQANFVLVQDPDPEEARQYLLEKGVLVRTFGAWPDVLRVSLGLPTEHERFVEALCDLRNPQEVPAGGGAPAAEAGR